MAELKSGSTIGGYTIWHRGNFDPATKLNANANAVSASKLETPRTISTTGDGTWSVSFDGTTNTTATLTLASTGVNAGTYKAVTVDVKGRVTAGLALTTGLVTSTTSTGTSNVVTTNTNTYLNVVETVGASPSSAGTSTQIIGAGTVTVTSDTGGKLTITGAQNITGNAGTATKLATSRTINGVAFDGSSNITIGEPSFASPLSGYSSSDANVLSTGGFSVRYLSASAANKPVGTDHAVMTMNYSAIWSAQQAFDWRTGNVFTRTQNNGTWLTWATQVDTRNFATTIPTFSVNSAGLVPVRVGSTTTRFLREDGTWVVPTDTTYATMTEATAIAGTDNSSSLITAVVLKSAIQTHAPTSVTGNAGTATKLATARTINGVSFDGTANITVADTTKLPTAGGTVTGGLAVNGLLTANGGFKGQYVATDNRTLKPNGTTKGTIGAYFTSQGGLTDVANTVYGDLLVLNSYSDSSGGLANALFFAKGSTSILHYQASQDATTWGAANKLAYVTDNVASATKLATARTINNVSFDGTSNITIADNTKVPLTGGAMSGSLSANALGVNNESNVNGLGVSLYGGVAPGMPNYGLAFSGTATFGTHGSVVGDMATYFTMSGATNRGWIFKSGNASGGNVASISAAGEITASSILSSGNITAFSDERLKDNITEISDALNKLKQLKGVTFTRKDLSTDKHYAGLIAQDVRKVLPEAVAITEEDIIAVDYNGVIGLLVEAIKELENRIAALECK